MHALLTRLTLHHDVAEDLFQELFIKLDTAKGFANAENPRAYAFRAAMNLAFDWHRKQKRTHTESLDTNLPGAAAPPLRELIDAEEELTLLEKMAALAEPFRSVLALRYIQAHDFNTIAQTMNKTPAQVRSICHRALAKLRKAVGTDDGSADGAGRGKGQADD